MKWERFKYFDKFDIKKYYDKEEFKHLSLNVFDDFRITKNMIKKFEQQWNEAVWSFIHLLNFREKFVLIECCAFNSATYIKKIYYIVVDFLRGNFSAERRKSIFERL